ncbi:hypothetical protein DFH29DRAFT_999530 [Suillus ampliporus]|nr:hypothetical protein DFH29DRAFT_999530 [Suillus ampliporus]
MPAVRQRVCRSARLQANARGRLKVMEPPSHPSASRGIGKAQGRGSNIPHNQAPKTTTPRIIVHWTRPSDLCRTDTLVQHLVTHPLDAHLIFYEGKKTATSSNEERPSGKDKGEIYRVLVKLIFENDSEYSGAYAEDSKKFDIAVGNRIVSLKKSFKEQLDKFNKTGAGVTPLDENAAVNLHKQVLLEFPWYDQLHPFLFSNPTCGAKIFTSQPGVDHARDFYTLVRPCGGAGPSTHQNAPGAQLPPTDPQLPSPDPQPPSPDPQLPSPSPHAASAQPRAASTQPYAASAQPDPAGLLYPPPPSRHPPPFMAPPPPSRHPPPPHYTGTWGSPIDDPDGDLDADPHAAADDGDGPFFAPLGNVLDTLDDDFDMYDNDARPEFNSSRRHVISLDSPPKVVGHKRQYAASPSPPPVDTNSFILPRKPQTPTYHSCAAFGSASPGSQAPHRPSSFASSSGISRSCSTPSSTASSLPHTSSSYRISPMASQTSLSAKPQSSARSKKKRTSAADVEDHLSVINGEIQSMHSDMSERRESRNERYALKMDYQSQKKEYQWRCESRSHEILLSATNHQREQEAQDKEILRIKAATALQEKEAEIWCLKIQYESIKLHTAGGDIACPSSLSPSI